MLVGIGFIVIGGFFIVSLLMALVEILFKIDWDKETFNARKVLGVFKWMILSFILLVVFIYALNVEWIS